MKSNKIKKYFNNFCGKRGESEDYFFFFFFVWGVKFHQHVKKKKKRYFVSIVSFF